MWPLSSRPSDSAVVGDVKVALPPPLGALDLRDRRFQIGSVRSASYPSSNPESSAAAVKPASSPCMCQLLAAARLMRPASSSSSNNNNNSNHPRQDP
ncbi:hypothetical protein MCOR02_000026 [Pyricularia oryzae]|nr:hypothetical protein MCOR02_000026 [Pyricularia oryzae]